MNQSGAASTQLMAELADTADDDEKLYYEGAGQEAMDKWR